MFEPVFDKIAKLKLQPLAPLSMVSVLPGSYYRSIRKPTKHMICGILENILEMHYSQKERNEFLKKMQQDFKKKYNYEFNKDECISSSGFTSILYPLINIELEVLPTTFAYDDLWTQHLKGSDKRHIDGVRNMDSKMYSNKKNLVEDLSKAKDNSEKDKIQRKFFKEFGTNFPNFYQSPKTREFIVTDDAYLYKIATNEVLLNKIEDAAKENNIAYLGTSEGWVNVEIEKL